jgi:hypothetical protein
MAYTIKYNGYDVECDTDADVRALLDKTPQSVHPKTSRTTTPTGQRKNTGMDALVAKLSDEQRELLRYVANHGRVARERLRQMVKVENPRQFAGLLIGISKSAAGSGMESPIESSAERENGRGPRVYHYKIRDSVKTEVKEALSK